MTQQDGPAEIERETLHTRAPTFIAWCPWCRTKFQAIKNAHAHFATCPQHPAVFRLACTRAALDVAVQQLAVAKRFIADIIELYNKSYEVQGPDIWDAAMKHGILVETIYDPALHGEQDAEVGDTWYVIAPAWRTE